MSSLENSLYLRESSLGAIFKQLETWLDKVNANCGMYNFWTAKIRVHHDAEYGFILDTIQSERGGGPDSEFPDNKHQYSAIRLLKVSTCAYCCYSCLDETNSKVQRIYCGLANKDMFNGTQTQLNSWDWSLPEWCPLPKERDV